MIFFKKSWDNKVIGLNLRKCMLPLTVESRLYFCFMLRDFIPGLTTCTACFAGLLATPLMRWYSNHERLPVAYINLCMRT